MSLETQYRYKPEMITPDTEVVTGQKVIALFGTTHDRGKDWRDYFTEGLYDGNNLQWKCFNPWVADWKQEYAKREADMIYASDIIVSYITNSSPDLPGRTSEQNGSIGSVTEVLSLARVALAQQKKMFIGFETLNSLESSITSPEGRASLAMTLEALARLQQRYPDIIHCAGSITPREFGTMVSERMNQTPMSSRPFSKGEVSGEVVVLGGYTNEPLPFERKEFYSVVQRSKSRFIHIKSQALLADWISMRVLREKASRLLDTLESAGMIILQQDATHSYQLDNQIASQYAECIGKSVMVVQSDSKRNTGVLPVSLSKLSASAKNFQNDIDPIDFDRDKDSILNAVFQIRLATDLRRIVPDNIQYDEENDISSTTHSSIRLVSTADSRVVLSYDPYRMGIPYAKLRTLRSYENRQDLVDALLKKTVADYRRERVGADGQVEYVKTDAQRAQALIDGHQTAWEQYVSQHASSHTSSTNGRHVLQGLESYRDELLFDMDSHSVNAVLRSANILQDIPDSMSSKTHLEVLMRLLGGSSKDASKSMEVLTQMVSDYAFSDPFDFVPFETDVESIASQDQNGNPIMKMRTLLGLWHTYFSLPEGKVDSSMIFGESLRICKDLNIPTDKLFDAIVAAIKLAKMRLQKEKKEKPIDQG